MIITIMIQIVMMILITNIITIKGNKNNNQRHDSLNITTIISIINKEW